MKLKELESELQPLKGFDAPKRELEQYVTGAHLASRMIFTAEASFGDIDDKNVLDLGCGCAVLSVACVLMGANSVVSVDADPSALSTARENIASLEMQDHIHLIHAALASSSTDTSRQLIPKDVPVFSEEILCGLPSVEEEEEEDEREGDESEEQEEGRIQQGEREIDTVVMNPPFGSWTEGVDMVFLEVGCRIAKTAVYSLNKSSTREFIMKKAATFGFKGQVLAEMKYALPKTMAFHKSKSVDVQVDFWRFERVRPKPPRLTQKADA